MPEGQSRKGWTSKVFKMLAAKGIYEDSTAGYNLF